MPTDTPLSATRILATQGPEVSPRRRELRRLADATRVFIEGLFGTDADEATISAAADVLEGLGAGFDHDAPRSMYDGIAESAMAGGDPGAFFDHSPLIGRANPIAPPITLEIDDDLVIGRVTFGSAYEGPPGCVHGGYVAAAFDEILGSAQTFSGSPGMTGTLSVRYEKPTPLHTELRIEGRFVRMERRKVFTVGQMYAGDDLTATAEGLFITIGFERFGQLHAEREARLGHRSAAGKVADEG